MMVANMLKSKLDELSHLNRTLTKGDIDSIPEDIQFELENGQFNTSHVNVHPNRPAVYLMFLF